MCCVFLCFSCRLFVCAVLCFVFRRAFIRFWWGALLPTAAFAVGLWRGLRRAFARPGGIDTLFLLLVVFTVAGYTAFTWRNPWYVTLKGSYLLGLMVPFGFYTSEVLADWVRRPGLRQGFVWTALVALLTLSAL